MKLYEYFLAYPFVIFFIVYSVGCIVSYILASKILLEEANQYNKEEDEAFIIGMSASSWIGILILFLMLLTAGIKWCIDKVFNIDQ